MSENKISIFQRTRNNFLTGLILVAPVTLTGYLVWGAIKFFDEKVIPLVAPNSTKKPSALKLVFVRSKETINLFKKLLCGLKKNYLISILQKN